MDLSSSGSACEPGLPLAQLEARVTEFRRPETAALIASSSANVFAERRSGAFTGANEPLTTIAAKARRSNLLRQAETYYSTPTVPHVTRGSLRSSANPLASGKSFETERPSGIKSPGSAIVEQITEESSLASPRKRSPSSRNTESQRGKPAISNIGSVLARVTRRSVKDKRHKVKVNSLERVQFSRKFYESSNKLLSLQQSYTQMQSLMEQTFQENEQKFRNVDRYIQEMNEIRNRKYKPKRAKKESSFCSELSTPRLKTRKTLLASDDLLPQRQLQTSSFKPPSVSPQLPLSARSSQASELHTADAQDQDQKVEIVSGKPSLSPSTEKFVPAFIVQVKKELRTDSPLTEQSTNINTMTPPPDRINLSPTMPGLSKFRDGTVHSGQASATEFQSQVTEWQETSDLPQIEQIAEEGFSFHQETAHTGFSEHDGPALSPGGGTSPLLSGSPSLDKMNLEASQSRLKAGVSTAPGSMGMMDSQQPQKRRKLVPLITQLKQTVVLKDKLRNADALAAQREAQAQESERRRQEIQRERGQLKEWAERRQQFFSAERQRQIEKRDQMREETQIELQRQERLLTEKRLAVAQQRARMDRRLVQVKKRAPRESLAMKTSSIEFSDFPSCSLIDEKAVQSQKRMKLEYRHFLQTSHASRSVHLHRRSEWSNTPDTARSKALDLVGAGDESPKQSVSPREISLNREIPELKLVTPTWNFAKKHKRQLRGYVMRQKILQKELEPLRSSRYQSETTSCPRLKQEPPKRSTFKRKSTVEPLPEIEVKRGDHPAVGDLEDLMSTQTHDVVTAPLLAGSKSAKTLSSQRVYETVRASGGEESEMSLLGGSKQRKVKPTRYEFSHWVKEELPRVPALAQLNGGQLEGEVRGLREFGYNHVSSMAKHRQRMERARGTGMSARGELVDQLIAGHREYAALFSWKG